MKTYQFKNCATDEITSIEIHPHSIPHLYHNGRFIYLAYWECRFDFLAFVCDVYDWQYEDVILIDADTQEVLDYYDLADEQERLYYEEEV